MKRIHLLILLTCPAYLFAQNSTMSNRLIVKLKGNTETVSNGKRVSIKNPQAQQRLSSMGIEQMEKIVTSHSENGNSSNQMPLLIRLNDSTDPAKKIKELLATGLYEYVELDHPMVFQGDPVEPNDTYFSNQWSLNNDGSYNASAVADADIDMPEAWGITQGSSSIIVAITDTGLRMSHPEFAGRIWTNANEIAGNGIDDDGNGFIDDVNGWDFADGNNDLTDLDGHGTNVTGIATATGNNADGYAGVNWNCQIMPLKVFEDAGNAGFYSYFIAAIYYAVDHDANVINMSLGGTATSTALQDVLTYATENNVAIVASMMNQNSEITFYPAGYASVIAVGATDVDNTRAPFSSYGNHIDISAPGRYIDGVRFDSDTQYYGGYSGTSQAAPHVAGVVSLMFGLDPFLTIAEVNAYLINGAVDGVGNGSEDVAGWDKYHGHGLLNAYNSLNLLATDIQAKQDECGTAIAGATVIASEGDLTVDNSIGDHWFSYTVPEDGVLRIIPGPCGHAEEDTKFAVYLNSCANQVGEYDDAASCGLQSQADLDVNTGDVYYINFSNEKTSASYQATLALLTGDAGEFCDNPEVITAGSHTANVSAGNHWFSYTFPENGSLTISSCGNTALDTQLDFYTDCNTLDFTADDCSTQSTYTTNGLFGEEKLFVWEDANDRGSFQFDVSLISNAASCASATQITSPGSNFINGNSDQWYYYTATEYGVLKISTLTSNKDTKFDLYLNDCTISPEVFDDETVSYNQYQSEARREMQAGDTYYIMFDDVHNPGFFFAYVDFYTSEGEACQLATNVEAGVHTADLSAGNAYYQFSFPNTGYLTISSCNDARQNTLLDIYSDCNTLLAYSEDECGDGLQSTYSYSGSVHEILKFAWLDPWTSGDNLFDFEIDFVADSCQSASITTLTTTGIYTADNTSGDHVFKYVAEQSGNFIISTIGLTDEDTYIGLASDCDGWPNLGLNDNYFYGGSLQSKLGRNVTQGETYYIMMGDRWARPHASTDAIYSFQIGYSGQEEGFACDNPSIITDGYHYSSQSLGAQYYAFTVPTNGSFTIAAYYDLLLDIYSGTSCTTNIYSGGADGEVLYVTIDNVTAGSDYILKIADYYGPQEFELSFNANRWNGRISTDWNTASNWNQQIVPTLTDHVIIPYVANAPIVSSANAAVNNLTLEDGAVLQVINNQTLTINGNLVANTGRIEVASGASLITNGAVSGTNHVFKRSTTFDESTGKYSAIGSPVSNENTDVLGSIVYSYDESIAYGSGSQERYTRITSAETMNPGDGYFSAFTGEVTFTGTPNTGTVNVSLIYNGADGANAGFNLVSNPYPSALDFASLVANNPDISGTIYIWDDGGSNTQQRGNGDYITVNSIGQVSNGSGRGGDWNGYLGLGQGFFVQALTSGTLSFTNDMRVVGFNDEANSYRTSSEEIPTIKIGLANSLGISSETLLGFPQAATAGYDRLFDAQKFDGTNGLKVYSSLENLPMSIQGLPLEKQTIPLFISVEEAGQHELTFDFSEEFKDWNISLRDLKTGAQISINEENSFSFSSAEVQDENRFNLILEPENVLAINDLNGLDIQYFKDRILLTNFGTEKTSFKLQIMDLTGRKIFAHEEQNSGNQSTIDFNFSPNQIYVIHVATDCGQIIQKIVFH